VVDGARGNEKMEMKNDFCIRGNTSFVRSVGVWVLDKVWAWWDKILSEPNSS